MSCSKAQHIDAGKAQTQQPLDLKSSTLPLSSLTLNIDMFQRLLGHHNVAKILSCYVPNCEEKNPVFKVCVRPACSATETNLQV